MVASRLGCSRGPLCRIRLTRRTADHEISCADESPCRPFAKGAHVVKIELDVRRMIRFQKFLARLLPLDDSSCLERYAEGPQASQF
jgi:hypothetical protein